MLQEFIPGQAYSQDYEKGGLHGCMMCMYSTKLGVCKGMLLQEIRCSEIDSEAIFGQKHSCSTYMVHNVMQSSFGCHA